MSEISTTKLSSRGQVVIPEDIRKRLGLEPGTRFVVLGEDDTVVLKTIRPPQWEEFDDLVSRARATSRRADLRKADLDDAIERIRNER